MPTVLDTVVQHVDEYGDEYMPSDRAVPIVSDDEAEEQEEHHQESQPGTPPEIQDDTMEESKGGPATEAPISEFNLELDLQNEDKTNTTNSTMSKQENLYWHTKLGHLSKARMQQLAKRGAIPKSLATIDPPMCVACIHGEATKKSWRTKARPARTPKVATSP
jgi:hypothetical protein